jgi:hypothetical protein
VGLGGCLVPFIHQQAGPVPRGHEVDPVVAVEVGQRDLPSQRDILSRPRDGVPREGGFRGVPLVVVENGRIVDARVALFVGVDALAGDEFGLAVAVEIRQRRDVALRPGFIDDVFLPVGRAVRPRRQRLPS